MDDANNILATIRGHLQKTRGRWMVVSRESGVPYHTLTKIAQGKVSNPRLSTVQLLMTYFEGNGGSRDSMGDAGA